MTPPRYPNLNAAYAVMIMDQGTTPHPDGVRQVFLDGQTPLGYLISASSNGAFDLDQAEATLTLFRTPEDVGNTDSPLSVVCCGEEEEMHEIGNTLAGDAWPNLHAALDELFMTIGC